MLSKIRKAITAAIAGGVAALVAAAQDGRVTSTEWMVVIGSALVAGAAVWVVPNKEASSGQS